MSLYEQMKAAGIPMDNHESDLGGFAEHEVRNVCPCGCVAVVCQCGCGNPPEIIDCSLHAQAAAMREALEGLNGMSNYALYGFCSCPRGDGHARDSEHSTACQQARSVLAATGRA